MVNPQKKTTNKVLPPTDPTLPVPNLPELRQKQVADTLSEQEAINLQGPVAQDMNNERLFREAQQDQPEVKTKAKPPLISEPEVLEADTQPAIRPLVESHGIWFGYNKAGKLLIRSRNQAAVRQAVEAFGGW